MLTLEELEQLLALDHETRSFEVKGRLHFSNRAHVGKVARAAMAMGNLRDGGVICIGIDDTQMSNMLPGLEPDSLVAWSNYDNVSAALATYSDPPVTFDLKSFELANGSNVVVLAISEFDVVPHICKRDTPEVNDGALYVRPRRKPESVAVPSLSEMRELMDLATTKGVREFLRRAGAAGLPFALPPTPEETDRAAYEEEAAEAWGEPSTLMVDLLAAGYTDVSVRPSSFDEHRLAPPELQDYAWRNTVRMRGWPVPFFDQRTSPIRHSRWLGQDISPSVVPHMEAWRVCGSGQFLHRRVLVSDLEEVPHAKPSNPEIESVVILWDVLLYLVEVAELGARIATTLDVESVTFDVSLNNVANRELVSADWNRPLHGLYVTAANSLAVHRDVPTARLVAEPRHVGVELAQAILSQFGLDSPTQLLFDLQEEVFTRA